MKKHITSDAIQQYSRFGMAAILPGLVRAGEIIAAEIETIRATLGEEPKRRGRPAKSDPAFEARAKGGKRSAPGVAAYWAKFTPEERAAEMKRRQAVRRKRVKREAAITAKREAAIVTKILKHKSNGAPAIQ